MNGPFQSLGGGSTIAKFTKDELLPITKRIRELSIEASKFRANFIESLVRKQIDSLEDSYKKNSVDLVSAYHKWSTPDELFKDLNIDNSNPQQFGPIIGDYFRTQQAMMVHFNEGFRLLGYIDSILTSQSTASFNRISINLSSLAILISIIVLLLK